MIALTFALLFLTLFLFGRGYWQHIALPKLQNQRLKLQLVRVKRQGQYLKLWLQHPDGVLLPKAKAGQHILLYGKDLQGKPVSRAYSLAQDCSQQRYYQLVIKAETDGRLSQALFQQLKVGDLVESSYPRGHFLLNRSRQPLVLVAGGVGITPMLAMAYAAIRQKRQVFLVYQARRLEDIVFYPLLRRLPRLQLRIALTQPPADWQGFKGRIDAGYLYKLAGPQAQYYFCASAKMTEQLIYDLGILGAQHCYAELFSAAASEQSFPIEINGVFADSQGHKSVLDAILAARVPLNYDCKGGSCGLCKVKVVQGQYQQVLEPSISCGADEVLACCIQPTSALVLSAEIEAEKPSSEPSSGLIAATTTNT